MQKTLLTLAAVVLISNLSGCVSVKEHEPETVSTTTTTTRHTSLAPVPSTTTVERTTTY